MFELSDDEDEHFWNDLPLNDITVKANITTGPANKKPQLRVPDASCTGPPTKKLCTERNFVRDHVVHSVQGPGNKQRKDELKLVVPNTESTEIHKDSGNQRKTDIDGQSEDISRDYITPKRKRKFPGPAGVLPKLMPGQSLDIGLHMPTSENRPKESKSPQEEQVVLCSQSSENLFLDDPWQALLKDIGDDGLGIMRKFSIASTLLKAGKKQLYQGKAWLLFGIIESLENHGSEASASIKDRSGKMHGTIHNDLMTEYETELQVGTVLVLKQVSIISISNKNHYLNITPNNLVSLYHIKENTLKSLHFHGSQDSLHSVLKALENEATVRREQTPDTSLSSGRRSLSSSGTNTPVLSTGSPAANTLNRLLFNTHSGSYTPNRNQNYNVPGVRDVSVTPRNSSVVAQHSTPRYTPVIPQSYNKTVNQNSNISYTGDNSSTHQNSSVSRHPGIGHHNHTSVNVTSVNMTPHSVKVTSVNRTPQQNICSKTTYSEPKNNPVTTSTSKWRFRSPSSSVVNSPTPLNKSSLLPGQLSENNNVSFNKVQDRLVSTGRTCQLQTSAYSSISHSTNNNRDYIQNTKHIDTEKNLPDKAVTNPDTDLWEDDLSDDILSQLTDDMT